jgi:hypothetical protein
MKNILVLEQATKNVLVLKTGDEKYFSYHVVNEDRR